MSKEEIKIRRYKQILAVLDQIIILISIIGLYRACLNENVLQAISSTAFMVTATIDYNFRNIQKNK